MHAWRRQLHAARRQQKLPAHTAGESPKLIAISWRRNAGLRGPHTPHPMPADSGHVPPHLLAQARVAQRRYAHTNKIRTSLHSTQRHPMQDTRRPSRQMAKAFSTRYEGLPASHTLTTAANIADLHKQKRRQPATAYAMCRPACNGQGRSA